MYFDDSFFHLAAYKKELIVKMDDEFSILLLKTSISLNSQANANVGAITYKSKKEKKNVIVLMFQWQLGLNSQGYKVQAYPYVCAKVRLNFKM